MKKLLIGLSTLALSLTAAASNKVGVGAALGYSDSIYKGAENEAYPIPLLDINYGNFYVKGIALGYTFYQDDAFAASLYLDPLGGFAVKGSDLGNGYNAIDDRDFQAMFGIRLDADTGIYGIRTGFTAQAGEEGAQVKLSAFRPYHVNSKLVLVPSIHIKGYSSDFSDYYFGVTSEEKNRSGNDKITNSYEADAAYSYGVNLTAEYSVSHNLSLVGFLGAEKFSDEISDSPIVEDEVLFLLGAGAKFYF